MGLYTTNDETGFVHAEAPELERKLQEGDGILWQGDPNLELGMETYSAPVTGWFTIPTTGKQVYVQKGDILARRYAVYRHCEDGTTQRIGHWRLEDFDRILMDIAPMRLDAPNRESTIDRIDRENAEAERDNDRAVMDAMGAGLEYTLKLDHDINQGRNVFRGMPGLRDIKLPESVDMTAKVENTLHDGHEISA